MHVVIGLVLGTALGLLAGSAAVKYTATATEITVPARKTPAITIPSDRHWDI